MKLVVSRAAAADLARLRAFLADKNPAAAQRAISGLVDAIDSLAAFPDRGRASGVVGLRELVVPLGRSAYVVRFAHDLQRQSNCNIWTANAALPVQRRAGHRFYLYRKRQIRSSHS